MKAKQNEQRILTEYHFSFLYIDSSPEGNDGDSPISSTSTFFHVTFDELFSKLTDRRILLSLESRVVVESKHSRTLISTLPLFIFGDLVAEGTSQGETRRVDPSLMVLIQSSN